jgi:UDP-N-acetylglucosamine:LPS N-acetylglucosamine transferase
MRIALVGGGTGGHIFPLLAVYKYYQIKKSGKKSSLPEFDFVWMGEKNSLEQKIA